MKRGRAINRDRTGHLQVVAHRNLVRLERSIRRRVVEARGASAGHLAPCARASVAHNAVRRDTDRRAPSRSDSTLAVPDAAGAAEVAAEAADATADVTAEVTARHADVTAEAGANDEARAADEVRAMPPAEPRASDAEVHARSPAPDPRRGDPGPAVGRRVDVLVWIDGRAVRRRRRVDVLLTVRHPEPAALLRVDPLPRSR